MREFECQVECSVGKIQTQTSQLFHKNVFIKPSSFPKKFLSLYFEKTFFVLNVACFQQKLAQKLQIFICFQNLSLKVLLTFCFNKSSSNCGTLDLVSMFKNACTKRELHLTYFQASLSKTTELKTQFFFFPKLSFLTVKLGFHNIQGVKCYQWVSAAVLMVSDQNYESNQFLICTLQVLFLRFCIKQTSLD